jgi:hypothetical protein
MLRRRSIYNKEREKRKDKKRVKMCEEDERRDTEIERKNEGER